MLGDREKCIQAQMDEYLSKPLKQNHLIQTILKCATLGGALLEKGRDVRSSPKDESPKPLSAANGALSPAVADPSTLRPAIEPRAYTTTGPISHGSLESPAMVSADQEDPLARVSEARPPIETPANQRQLLMRAHSS
jgi:osomolarity two-component system, sensor histidine kinase NIK1